MVINEIYTKYFSEEKHVAAKSKSHLNSEIISRKEEDSMKVVSFPSVMISDFKSLLKVVSRGKLQISLLRENLVEKRMKLIQKR